MKLMVVFLGGGLGAAARYLSQGLVYRITGSGFPYGTLSVNILGCLLIGFLMSAFEERFVMNPLLRVFLTIGILGGFTTFSSFAYETMALIGEGSMGAALVNVVASVVICLGATWLGMTAGRFV